MSIGKYTIATIGLCLFALVAIVGCEQVSIMEAPTVSPKAAEVESEVSVQDVLREEPGESFTHDVSKNAQGQVTSVTKVDVFSPSFPNTRGSRSYYTREEPCSPGAWSCGYIDDDLLNSTIVVVPREPPPYTNYTTLSEYQRIANNCSAADNINYQGQSWVLWRIRTYWFVWPPGGELEDVITEREVAFHCKEPGSAPSNPVS